MHPLLGPALGFVILALAAGLVAGAAKRDALRRSSRVGIRTSATLASDQSWTAGHRAAAPWLQKAAALAGAMAIVAFAALLWAPADLLAAVSNIAPIVGYGASIAMIVRAAFVADRAAAAA